MIKRVGVIGGGQLAWMMAAAVEKLGLQLLIQTPHSSDPAVAIATSTVLAPIADATATASLAVQSDVITFENEFIDLDALLQLAKQGVCFRPPLEALTPLLDKYNQRCYLQKLGLPTPQFTIEKTAATNLGFPVVLKARRHGYDGQGTFILKDQAAFEEIWQKLGEQALAEAFVPFDRELAIIAARSSTGEVVTYPVVETHQQDQVCRWVLAPAVVDEAIAAEVRAIARTLLNNLQVVGVFGIELFLIREGKVLVNEIAPRTHNSGHFSLDACETSQFEQQLRAVCDLPLGSPNLICEAAIMVNLLGYESGQLDAEPLQSSYLAKQTRLAQLPQTYLHWYSKTATRPGRKLGHVTVLLNTLPANQQRQKALEIIQQIEAIWYSENAR